MRRVEFSIRSRRDLNAAENYWLASDPDLYRQLTLALEEALQFLLHTPSAGSPVDRSKQRKWRIGRTPFLLFYGFDARVLRVARIRHQHENWRRSH